MKPQIKILIVIFCLMPFIGLSQIVPRTKKLPKQEIKEVPKIERKIEASNPNTTTTAITTLKEQKGCKSIDLAKVNSILDQKVARSLNVKLDREDSYLRFNRQTKVFSISDYRVRSIAHEWVYFMNDVNSTKSYAHADRENNRIVLVIEFEGDKSEIKGICPGCMNRYEDSRAPDINWLGERKLKIALKPIVHDNSISFVAVSSELTGHFTMNGAVQAFLPGLITYFETKIMESVELQTKNLINQTGVRNMLAEAFKETVEALGFTKINTVEFAERNMYVCNN